MIGRCATLIILLSAFLMVAGCLSEQGDPVVGTWEWSDGKGYVEQYTFQENQSFHAEALGSTFSGIWTAASPGHYQVTYRNDNDSVEVEVLTDILLYDRETDQLYFPGHTRVKQ